MEVNNLHHENHSSPSPPQRPVLRPFIANAAAYSPGRCAIRFPARWQKITAILLWILAFISWIVIFALKSNNSKTLARLPSLEGYLLALLVGIPLVINTNHSTHHFRPCCGCGSLSSMLWDSCGRHCKYTTSLLTHFNEYYFSMITLIIVYSSWNARCSSDD